MEILVKIILTTSLLTLMFFALVNIPRVWKSHIDVKATVAGIWKSKGELFMGSVITRKDDAIYQNNQIVGKIGGEVIDKETRIMFKEIYDTGNLDIKSPFEYKRSRCKIVSLPPENSGATLQISSSTGKGKTFSIMSSAKK